MKAVLLSIRSEWCKKIFIGEKTVEIRKTRPKLETPFKVYIAQSAGVDLLHGERKSSQLIRSSQCCLPRGLNFVV